ncbi:MAG: ATP-dependent Clp protease ATP-binding subunit ClpX, partial [Adhaeribacter sp.]
LRRILTEPKNSIIKQYQRLFEMENITITFDEDAMDYIVEKAAEYKLGARGLRSICEGIMTDAMFDLPSQEEVTELCISLEYARTQFEKSTSKQLKVA